MYYTYLIGWSSLDKYYYGVRFSKYSFVGDIWKTYFTSSKIVTKFREEHGEPDIIQVRKIFNNKRKAILWESSVLRRLNVRNNERWLNAASIPEHWNLNSGEPHNKGKSLTPEQKEKISKTRKKLGLGKKSEKYLPKHIGDDNIMRNPEYIKLYKEKITGRRMITNPDGTRSWFYPNK
jgi:hypothetical protein